MAKPRLQAEIVPNQDCRLYHTNFVMSEDRIGQMLEGLMMSDEEKKLKKAPEAVKNLAVGIQSIPGVLTWNLTRYQVQVVKAPLFDWSEIEPQIIGLIRTVGQELLGEEIEYVEKPIWEFQKWGLNEDGTKRRRSLLEDSFADLDE